MIWNIKFINHAPHKVITQCGITLLGENLNSTSLFHITIVTIFRNTKFYHKQLNLNCFLYSKEKGLSQVFTFVSNFCFLCLQVLNISCLLFSVLLWPLYMMWYFSTRHKRHFLVIGLKLEACSMKSHSIS